MTSLERKVAKIHLNSPKNWSPLSRAAKKIHCISLYSVRMRENTDQKNSQYGHFSSSGKGVHRRRQDSRKGPRWTVFQQYSAWPLASLSCYITLRLALEESAHVSDVHCFNRTLQFYFMLVIIYLKFMLSEKKYFFRLCIHYLLFFFFFI